MNNISKIFKALALTAVSGAMLLACTPEPKETVAKAVLGDVSLMEFSAANPAEQTVTVYSDGEWHTTAPEWIHVTPDTGNGVVTVTVTADPNVDEGGMLEPRKDNLIFSGNTLASRLIIQVNQEGDAYRNAEEVSLSDVAAKEDGKAVIINDGTVAAVSSAGLVIANDATAIYVKTKAEAIVGDKVKVKGIKGTLNNLPAITQADDVNVYSAGTFNYPAEIYLNDIITTYQAKAMDYVTVSGIVASGNLIVTVGESTYSIKQVDCPAALSISKLNGNKVDLTGYMCGELGASLYGIITTKYKDNGPSVVPRPAQLLYAKWRFTTSLLTGYAQYFGGTGGLPDKNPGTGGLYVPSNVEGNGKIEFYQIDKNEIDVNNKASRIVGGTGHPYVTGVWPGDYWQFSATDNYEYPAGTNLHVKFLTRVSGTGQKYWMLEYFDGNEWKPADEYPVAVEEETGTNAQYNFVEQSSNIEVECSWQLAAPCREPKFRMRCVANWQFNGNGALEAPNGGTCRIADNDDGKEDAGPIFEVTDAPADSGGGEGSAAILPVVWRIQTGDRNYNETWPVENGIATEEGKSGYVLPVEGEGMIWYNNAASNAADQASGLGKTKLDVSGKDPRVVGAWPGDYCQFKVPGTVAKGKKVRITFETRTSKTNPKYWELQYLDGNDYKPAAELKKTTVDGEGEVSFTHVMNADGSTNIKVDATVTYANKTNDIVFRFVCKTALQASGDGVLEAPNGGTWRLAITDENPETSEWQPTIQWAY